MNYLPYSEYAESSEDWLGNIPHSWESSLLKRWHSVTLGKMLQPAQSDPADTEEFYLRAANIAWSGVNISDVRKMWFSPYDKQKYKLASGDLVVSEGGDVGRYAIWKGQLDDCFIQNAIHRIRSRKTTDNRFLYYWIFFLKHVGYIDLICNKATIAHYTAEKVQDSPCVNPPVEEQTHIANFLDRETAKIDNLIEKQEQLIKLLEEKRQAVISHAVTKGLNPNVPMKDSEVEWLGEVPEHWDVKRLKHAKGKGKASFVDGPFGSNLKSEHFISNGDVYVIESGFATKGVLDESKLKTISFEHFQTIIRSETTHGDIIIAKIGARFGKASILPELDKPAVVSGNSMKLTVNSEIADRQYIRFVLAHLKQEGAMEDIVNATAQPALSLGGMNNLVIPMPDLPEQREIVVGIVRRVEEVDAVVKAVRSAITLSSERRTALISAAVTGKIDVREAV